MFDMNANATDFSAVPAPRALCRTLMLATALTTTIMLASCATTDTAVKGDTPAQALHTDNAKEPQNDNALREAAITSTKSQDYVAAAAYWGSLYDKNESDTEAALNYSKALRQIGSVAQALTVMQNAQRGASDNGDVMAEYGKVLAATGHPDQASAVLSRAFELKPKDWTVLSAQGVTFDQLGRYKDAQAKYQAALDIVPDNSNVLTNLGLSYAIEGNLDNAESTLRKAVANPRASASARQNLAVVLALQGKFDEATRLARADLPLNVADNNIAYLRDMLTQPALWKQMETLDQSKPATN
ncbi:MAG: tetratricopeptide repeat protein [Parvibaculum sp.]|nr:tetratricopeptide repeat protein [Parvibaculum sp.]